MLLCVRLRRGLGMVSAECHGCSVDTTSAVVVLTTRAAKAKPHRNIPAGSSQPVSLDGRSASAVVNTRGAVRRLYQPAGEMVVPDPVAT